MKIKRVACVILISVSLFCVAFSFKIKPKIRNGSPSQFGQFPFFVHLETIGINNPNITFYCGGTLLNQNFILTAAHCMHNKSKITVRLGMLQIHRANEMGRKTLTVKSNWFHIHPEYDPVTLMNDIGLIQLRESIRGSYVIQPVSFPKVCDVHEGLDLIAIGYGRCGKDNQIPSTVQYTTLKTISSENCREIFNDIDPRKTFCAKGLRNESRISEGDSGGAVVHPTDYTLYGISSFENGLNRVDLPQGFTNVFAYTSWISKITKIKFSYCN